MSDYGWFALAVSPFVAIPLGFWAVASGVTSVGYFLVCYGVGASIGCAQLLAHFWQHGIHNDR